MFCSSCLTSKEQFDESVVRYSIKKAEGIKELAEFAVAYTVDGHKRTFRTDTLPDKKVRKKFNRNGQGGLVTVTYRNDDNNIESGLIDSTVIFKQTSLRGVTEIIFDFATTERTFSNERRNSQQFVFRYVTNRIYYRRRPIPMM